MFNILSWLIGLVCLILAIPLQLPILGLGLWIVLPIAVIGAGSERFPLRTEDAI